MVAKTTEKDTENIATHSIEYLGGIDEMNEQQRDALFASLRTGIEQVEAGKTIPYSEVRARLVESCTSRSPKKQQNNS